MKNRKSAFEPRIASRPVKPGEQLRGPELEEIRREFLGLVQDIERDGDSTAEILVDETLTDLIEEGRDDLSRGRTSSFWGLPPGERVGRFEVLVHANARTYLRTLSASKRRAVGERIGRLGNGSRRAADVSPLGESLEGLHRLAVKGERVVFEVERSTRRVFVLAIGPGVECLRSVLLGDDVEIRRA